MSFTATNPLLQHVQGMFGKVIVFRRFRGKTVLASRPKKRKRISKKQKVHLVRFEKAKEYARRQIADPVSKAEYQKGVNDRKHSAYAVAISDFFHAPEIHRVIADHYIGKPGDEIVVDAHDDFRVESVQVQILARNGDILEQGNAMRQREITYLWNYKATVAISDMTGVNIKVIVRDKPGNEAVEVMAV